MDLKLAGEVTVVTGGTGGIGRAVAAAFAAEQAPVAVWDLSGDVQTLSGELADRFGCPVIGLEVDVTEANSVRAALAETETRLGPVDHVVHCAAVGSGKFGFPFTNLAPDDWKKPLDVNVMGMVHVADVLGRRMMKRKTGTMIFLASVAGQIGSQTDPPYSAAKAANINFAQCLAKDLAADGIRVNTICPGMVQTPLNRSVWHAWNARQPESAKRSYEAWAGEKVREIVPLQQWQQPEDIADMAVFLSSHRAGQVTGQTINVDGGYVMHC